MAAGGLYVRLNAEYPTDDEFIEAGPLPELLYVRALCFCKRKLIDGVISTKQLPAVALGIPSAKRHAKTLVDVGLWEETDEGWVIVGWLKWNKSAKEVQSDRETRQIASAKANHAQYHLPVDGKPGKPSTRCDYCKSEGLVDVPKSDPKSEPPTDPDALRSRLPKPKTETEEEPKTEPETEEEPTIGDRRPTGSTGGPTNGRTTTGSSQQRIDTVLRLLADHQMTNAKVDPVNEDRYRGQVINTLLKQHGPRIRQFVNDRPDSPPETCAEALKKEIH